MTHFAAVLSLAWKKQSPLSAAVAWQGSPAFVTALQCCQLCCFEPLSALTLTGYWLHLLDDGRCINATINTLRRALGDSAADPQYIETLARRGYRLMPAIEHLESVPEPGSEKDREQREQSAVEISENPGRVQENVQEKVQRQVSSYWRKAALALASVVILVGAGYMSWRHFRSTTAPRKVMLAVLPFENLTGVQGCLILAAAFFSPLSSR